MILPDPNQIPPDEDEVTEDSPQTPQEKFAALAGSIIVDGTVQGLFAMWDKWLLYVLLGLTINAYVWWLGMTIIFVSVNWYDKKLSGELFVIKLQICLFATILAWLVKCM